MNSHALVSGKIRRNHWANINQTSLKHQEDGQLVFFIFFFLFFFEYVQANKQLHPQTHTHIHNRTLYNNTILLGYLL